MLQSEVRKVIAPPYGQLPAAAPEYYWGKVIHEKLVLLRFGSTAHRFIGAVAVRSGVVEAADRWSRFAADRPERAAFTRQFQ
ncbi:MAG: hypothetical protein OXH92_03475 [Bryobacterales bacterium]|nr:hypothetical protein [Bryobacterales bacterium]